MASWYAIRTATRQEQKVVSGLKEMAQQYDITADVYLPSETRWCRHARVKTTKEVPLMAGYLFIHIDPDHLWRVEDVFGVYRVLSRLNGAGRQVPATIPLLFVEELRLAQSDGGFDRTRPTGPVVKGEKGERVRVKGGQFTGFVGEIVAARGKKRASVVLEIFGRMWPAELSMDQLEPHDLAAKRAA